MKLAHLKGFVFFVGCLCFSLCAEANYLVIDNATIYSVDNSTNRAVLSFDFSWDNAVRLYDANNYELYDAAWVFIKYNVNNEGWDHATLYLPSYNTTGYFFSENGTVPSGGSLGQFEDYGYDLGADGDLTTGGDFDRIELAFPSDGKGVFLQRSEWENSTSPRTLDRDGVRIVWNFGADGVTASNIEDNEVDFQIFGIEMVYVEEGPYYLGDYGQFNTYLRVWPCYQSFKAGNTVFYGPWIHAEDHWEYVETNLDLSPGKISYVTDGGDQDFATDVSYPIPDEYPMGYNSFYMMKYELTQGQYRDFLNTLTQAQQTERVEADLTNENDSGTYVMVAEGVITVDYGQTIMAGPDPADGDPYTFGCTIDNDTVLDEENDGEWKAMNYLRWEDACAYADWAALRPITEMEWEEAARGVGQYYIQDEGFMTVWGVQTVDVVETDVATASMNTGRANETSQTAACVQQMRADEQQYDGPLRVGSLAESADGRAAAGAGYHGAYDMGGNLWDMIVTAGNGYGLAFEGTHGDGYLTTNGTATNTDWPYNEGSGVVGHSGCGSRGGAWNIHTSTATGGLSLCADRYSLNRVSQRHWSSVCSGGRNQAWGGRLGRQGVTIPDPRVPEY